MVSTLQDRVKSLDAEDSDLREEIQLAAARYRRSARAALERLRNGTVNHKETRVIAEKLHLIDCRLLWDLECQSTTFEQLLSLPSPEVGETIKLALSMLDTSERSTGERILQELLAKYPNHYVLLMVMGFYHLDNAETAYVGRYFEKATQTPAEIHPEHYRRVALLSLAGYYEMRGYYRNALNVLRRVAGLSDPDSLLLYQMGRMQGRLDQDEEFLETMREAVKKRPELMAVTMVDAGLKNVSREFTGLVRQEMSVVREAGKSFSGMLNEMEDITSDLRVHVIPPELETELETFQQHFDRVREGNYHAMREGMRSFYESLFPKVTQNIQREFLRRERAIADKIERYNDRQRQEMRAKSRYLSPTVGAGVGGLFYVFYLQLQSLMVFAIPLMEVLVAALGVFFGSYLTYNWLRGQMEEKLRDELSLNEPGISAKRVALLEERLQQFWEQYQGLVLRN
jgi:tetratricopeptide (TPR) repeat protein